MVIDKHANRDSDNVPQERLEIECEIGRGGRLGAQQKQGVDLSELDNYVLQLPSSMDSSRSCDIALKLIESGKASKSGLKCFANNSETQRSTSNDGLAKVAIAL
jgi:hypothetical protein